MKRTSVIWYILGAVVLIALGFVAGYALNGGFTRLGVGPAAGMMAARGFRGGFMPGMMAGGLRFGLGGLLMLFFWLGPLCGIAALLIVLTRRQPAAPAQVTAVAAPPAPAAPADPPAAAEPDAPAAEAKATRKK